VTLLEPYFSEMILIHVAAGGRGIESVFTGGLWIFRSAVDAGTPAPERSDATNRGGARMSRLNWNFGFVESSWPSRSARLEYPWRILPIYCPTRVTSLVFLDSGVSSLKRCK
jgi:hypothetical protein